MSARKSGIAAWCMYDWANSAFNTLIQTFIFAVFFTQAVAASPVEGAAQWGRAVGTAGFLVAILSPVLGAIADRGGRRKPWLALFTYVTVGATALLWFVQPDPSYALLALVLVGLAIVTFELSGVFYNSMLPFVAPPSMLGRVSGWGWGLGYFGGMICLLVALLGFVMTDRPLFGLLGKENQENIRATAVLVAVWYGLFALPLFLLTPDQRGTGVSAGQAVRQGLAQLAGTLRRLGKYRQILRFLVASAFYRDGLSTIFSFGGVFAAAVFGMEQTEIIFFAISLNVTAGLGAAGFAWIDDRVGAKPTILIALVGLVVFGVPMLLVESKVAFWVLGLGIGVFVGPAQAAGRSLMARLAPPELETEMFGLYNMSGKAVAFLGPWAFALATATFASERAGMATVFFFIAVGFLVMLTVREVRRDVTIGPPASATAVGG